MNSDYWMDYFLQLEDQIKALLLLAKPFHIETLHYLVISIIYSNHTDLSMYKLFDSPII